MDEQKTDATIRRIFGVKLPFSRGERSDKLLLHGPPPLVPTGHGTLSRSNSPIPIPPPLKKPSRFFRAFWRIQGKPFWEKNLTTLFYGPRSNGKSLHQAKTVREIFRYLEGMYNLFPELPQSIVVSNQKFNPVIEGSLLNNRLFYWESINQLRYCPRKNCWKENRVLRRIVNEKWVKALSHTRRPEGIPIPEYEIKPHRLHDAYVIIDDCATIIPADGWQDLPTWFRKLWAQAGHNGIHAIANVQDPVSIDINFRRYVDICFKFNKIMGNARPEAGKPPINLIWGIYSSREVPAEELWMYGDKSEKEIQQEKLDREEEEAAARAAGKKIIRVATRTWHRRIHFIRRRDTEIYDTLQNVPEYMPNKMEHVEILCTDPNCKMHKKGHGSVRHRII